MFQKLPYLSTMSQQFCRRLQFHLFTLLFDWKKEILQWENLQEVQKKRAFRLEVFAVAI